MIIWINGSFGVGKTTISENLNKMINRSIIYDPELIGTFLSNNIPIKEDDFQDYELWRTLNYDILKYLSTKYEIIIVPMTITSHVYYDEIIGKLEVDEIDIKHFILMASKENIIKRLNFRKDSTEWAYKQVDGCISAFENPEFKGKRIYMDSKSINEITCEIVNLLEM